MQDNTNYEDEIELIDLLRIIWKRKHLIILGSLFITLMGIGLAFYLPNVFEVVAIVEPGKQPTYGQNGQIVEEQILQDPLAIREVILSGAYDEIIRAKLNIPEANFPEIEVSIPKDTAMVKLVVESKNPQEAVLVLGELIRLVGESMQEKVDVSNQLLQHEISLTTIGRRAALEQGGLLKGQILETQKTIQELEAERKNAMAHRDGEAMAILLYSNEVQGNQEYLNRLQEKVKGLESMVLVKETRLGNLRQFMANIKALTVFKKPSIPGKPIKPKKGLIVVLSFVLGVTGTIVLVFFMDFVKNKTNN